jgi:hypothetical protein
MSIHIKPSHEGRLHRATGTKAGKKVSLSDEEDLKEHGTPAEKKEANFAINARKWHHGSPDDQREARRKMAKHFLRG